MDVEGTRKNIQLLAYASPDKPIRWANHALPKAKRNITPPIPMTLATDPNDSATQPKTPMPAIEVAVAIAV
jgi:hypothetical protein